MIDFIIVGAGFAGSVIAERIVNQLGKTVLIIEKRNHIGGNCYDFRDKNNIIVHKYGPHLFHTNSSEVFNYLSNFTDWNIYHHRVMAFIDGMKVPIPFNLKSLRMVFTEELANRIENKLISKYGFLNNTTILTLRHEKDPDLQLLANYIYDKIFVNYTVKQWGQKPEEIDAAVSARIPIRISQDDRYFDDKYQAIPVDGYGEIFSKMLNHPKIKIMLNTDFREVLDVDVKNETIFFLQNKFNGKLIYTGMIDELFDYCFGELSYQTLDLNFKTIQKEYFQELAVINYPNNYDFTRITEFKHIHPIKTPTSVILYEYPRKFRPGDVPYYPFFNNESKISYNKYEHISKKFTNLILIGRLAEYKYYDMDDIVLRALEIFKEKVL